MVSPKSQPSESVKHNYSEKISMLFFYPKYSYVGAKKDSQTDSILPTSTEWSLAFQSRHELNIKHYIHFDRCFKCLSVIDKPFLGPQSECVGILHYWFPLTLELLWCPAILILLSYIPNHNPPAQSTPGTHSLILSLPHR